MSRSNPFRFFLSRLTEDYLLLALVVGLVPLLWAASPSLSELAGLVHWQTLAALTGFLVLSRGLEDSGALARCGVWLMGWFRTERSLALALVVFSWLLAAVVTNDVALFIVVPLTVALAAVVPVPLGRLVIFQALAVNAGSALTPIGNPQNLFLWQTRGIGFGEFMAAMLPLVGLLTLVLLLATVLAFPARPVVVRPAQRPVNRRLLWVSCLLYPGFIVAAELGAVVVAALAIMLLYGLLFRAVLRGVDWLLLLVFMLMFVDLGLLAGLPQTDVLVAWLLALPGGVMTASVVVSQFISNVPATILLASFADDWQALAWGVSVGGFGLAIGSLANLIALRLARVEGLWREFHLWSLPALVLALGVAALAHYVV